MPQRIVSSILTFGLLAFLSTLSALAQVVTPPSLPVTSANDAWRLAQGVASSESRLDVVTIDQPQRRQRCHVGAFTPDEIVCSHAFGVFHTYQRQQILALILTGDGHLKLWLLMGVNSGLGAAIWGAVVLVATCPVCAAALGVVAFVGFFAAAGAVLIGDDQPDHLIYVAPGQTLTGKLRYVQH